MKELYYEAIAKVEADKYDEWLSHYGTPRHSGRYPWGSGKNPQRNKDLITRNRELEKQGVSKKERAQILGYTFTEGPKKGEGNTSLLSVALAEARQQKASDDYRQTMVLVEKGYSNTAIAERLGLSEGTVRNFRKRGLTTRMTAIQNTTTILKDQLKDLDGDYIDVGKGAEHYYGTTYQNLKTSLEVMKRDGYSVITVPVEQLGTHEKTNTKVLCPPGTTFKDVITNLDKIQPPQTAGAHLDPDTGEIKKMHAPNVVDPSRVMVRYAEEGGKAKDGMMEIRPGVADLDLGSNRYAQVRINVNDTHYLKGMATYGKEEDFPDGVDIIFNTNKHEGTPMLGEDKNYTVLKPLKDDPDPLNRFGALIDRQNDWTDLDGNEHSGALNIVRGEGEWSEWSKNIASQMLSKQPPNLAKQQLSLDYEGRRKEFEDIMSLENDTIKKQMLLEFADNCDSAAVHMKGAAFPRQGYHVILPLTDIKDNEIYAPGYEDGERVVLVRYPHQGIFEIPELIVNNKNRQGKEVLGANAKDAVGISSKVAEQLSGADFDGDTVLVIPNNDGAIRTKAPLEGLKDFDPKEIYKKGPNEVETKGHFNTQLEMGMISNLITDMTIQGASDDELARATRHSLTVIDAEKHNLNADQSFVNENITELKNLYQKKADPNAPGGGASTIVSRSTSKVNIPERKIARTVKDPETGEYIIREGIEVATGKKAYEETGGTHNVWKKDKNKKLVRDEEGRPVLKKVEANTEKAYRMELVDDAKELMSGPNHEGTQIERIYADYANKCKAMAQEARLAYLETPNSKYDPLESKRYANEVASIKAKVVNAQKNAPLERLAQRKGNVYMDMVVEDNPDLKGKHDEYKKEQSKALQRARKEVGANKKKVTLTEKEVEAVKAGAISSTLLREVWNNGDKDKLREDFMPKQRKTVDPTTKARIKAYAAKGYTQAQIADALGISTSTVSDVL